MPGFILAQMGIVEQKLIMGRHGKYYDAGSNIGANSGKETQYMRIELTPSSGELHASPISEKDYKIYMEDN